jgi:hypothetical protein
MEHQETKVKEVHFRRFVSCKQFCGQTSYCIEFNFGKKMGEKVASNTNWKIKQAWIVADERYPSSSLAMDLPHNFQSNCVS